ncbi:MAG: HlyD family efflux transporter periplasmic adaptor subunit [Phycisphaeraceae bacterium]|nr:HlyD family efflux transporter periplasmic adaptor subunit [Phycisphaeraceae bacterium]MBX3407818.1 HlyD family efflux transporter periplasmic adaptor subunit [Phycisphaeraceae bacterium]
MPTNDRSGPATQPRARGTALRRGLFGLCAAVVLVGAGVLVAMSPMPAQPAKTRAQAAAVDVATVSRMDFDVTTTATGDLRTRNQIEIRNRIDSDTTIIEIIEEGRRVRAGDVLVRLNAEPMQERLDTESLEIDSVRAALVEAEQGYAIQISENDSALRAAKLKLALATLDLEKWRSGQVVSKRMELAHSHDRAEKEEKRLGEKFERSKSLYERGYYSKDLLRQDELAWEQSVSDLARRKLDIRVYEEFEHIRDERQKLSDVEEAEAEVDRVERQNISRLASKEATLNNRRQALVIRDQRLTKLREQLAAAEIRAPSDGLVVYGTSIEQSRWGGDEGPMQVGTRVFPNQLLIVLPDTSEMIAAVKVHESLAGRVRPGQAVTVKVDAVGDARFPGRVESIGVLAEQTSRWMDPNLREYTVRIALDREVISSGRGADLKPSMRCEAEITLGHVADALAVPVQAVFNEGPVRYVHVQEAGSSQFVRRPVLLGQRSDRFAEVRAGLSVGERVLARRPTPNEIRARPWDEKELAAVGLKLGEQGQVVSIAGGEGDGRGAGRPGGPAGPNARPQRPGPARVPAEPQENGGSGGAPAASAAPQPAAAGVSADPSTPPTN